MLTRSVRRALWIGGRSSINFPTDPNSHHRTGTGHRENEQGAASIQKQEP
jgi:hypothetical protein